MHSVLYACPTPLPRPKPWHANAPEVCYRLRKTTGAHTMPGPERWCWAGAATAAVRCPLAVPAIADGLLLNMRQLAGAGSRTLLRMFGLLLRTELSRRPIDWSISAEEHGHEAMGIRRCVCTRVWKTTCKLRCWGRTKVDTQQRLVGCS